MDTVTSQPLVKEAVYNAPANRVWAAITDNNQMKEWYFKMNAFKPEVGFEFTFAGCNEEGVEYVHLCKVLEVVPNKKLVHSWTYKDYPGYSEVAWELFEEGDKTRLRLTHTGLDSFPDTPSFKRESFNQGWTEILGTMLWNYLEKA